MLPSIQIKKQGQIKNQISKSQASKKQAINHQALTNQISSPTSSRASTALEYDFLIIGYGNELCGDDAVGPWVARAVAEWQLPAVKSLAVPQLTPELTTELAKTNYVMFVDACGYSNIRTV